MVEIGNRISEKDFVKYLRSLGIEVHLNTKARGHSGFCTGKRIDVSKNKLVVFVMHKITENTLKKLNLLDKLLNEKNVIPVKRLEYFDFTKLIINSDFVITDGGSNQEELCYLGKPTLVLRTATERTEGIGENAVMFNGDIDTVSSFADEYEKYQKPPVIADISPSKVIAEHLTNEINNL